MSTSSRTRRDGDLLTIHEACSLLGVSTATLRRWSVAGVVEAFTTPGGHRRFARSTILALLPEHARPSAGPLPEDSRSTARRLVELTLAENGGCPEEAFAGMCSLLRDELAAATAGARRG